jgi:DMATS type aromatic prenyltransferase
MEFLSQKWIELCFGMGFKESEIWESVAELRQLIQPWADTPIGRKCRYRSYVAADGFPAEFSMSWRGRKPEVRILFESLGADFTARGAQDAGRALTRKLAGKPGVHIDWYRSIEDLFVTDNPLLGSPTIWHSLAARPAEPSRFKVYLNPKAHGAEHAAEVVGEALARIGMRKAWRPVAQRQDELAAKGHEIEFFALDLASPRSARAKVYFRHGPVTVDQLDTVASLAREHDSARAKEAYRAVYGGQPLIENEPLTCLSFRTGSTGPEQANVYLRLRPEPVEAILRAESARSADVDLGRRELLSFRTVGPNRPADVGLYLRFPHYDEQ